MIPPVKTIFSSDLHLGCNGVVHILFEPVKQEDPQNPVELLRLISNAGEEAVLVTLFSLKKIQPGTRLLFLKNHLHSSLSEPLQQILTEPVKITKTEKQSVFDGCDHRSDNLHGFYRIY